MTENEILDEGYDAYWEGIDVSDNPYADDTDDHRWWEEGWRAAWASLIGRRSASQGIAGSLSRD